MDRELSDSRPASAGSFARGMKWGAWIAALIRLVKQHSICTGSGGLRETWIRLRQRQSVGLTRQKFVQYDEKVGYQC